MFKSLVCLFLTALSFALPVSHAQQASSGINGTITDSTGAVVSGASVTARNTSTHVSSNITTNATGYYEFPNLPAGEYVVSVSAPGFSSTKSSPFTIETGQAARIDLPMKIGEVSATVNVSPASTLINSTTNDLGITIGVKQIDNLPVNERNLFELLALQPGVNADQNTAMDGPSTTSETARGGFEVNGAPSLANSILLDGVDATFGDDNGAGAGQGASFVNIIGLGGIAEFRTTTSVPPVEFGRAIGGVLSITTKPGTDAYHGSVFEFFRNDVMDAPSAVLFCPTACSFS